MEFPVIYIEWCDAVETQKAWESVEDLKKWADSNDWITSEVGWLLFESKEYILIANRIASIYEENQEYSGVMKIPTTWIKKRIDLSKHIK